MHVSRNSDCGFSFHSSEVLALGIQGMTGALSGEGPALNVVNYTDDTPGRGDGSISQASDPFRMDFDDALARQVRGNAILFRKDSSCLAQLAGRLSSADRRTVVLWGLECAGRVADRLEGMFPEDGRPSEAVRTCTLWSEGVVRLPEARRSILAVHGMARDVGDPVAAALCHAVGQGCSCVHTPGHAMGLPIYELTAILLEGGDGWESRAEDTIDGYLKALDGCEIRSSEPREWARFLQGPGNR